MFTRAFHHLNIVDRRKGHTTLINFDPGTINTKTLIAGWGQCGQDVEKATETFELATKKIYRNAWGEPRYYE